MSTVHDDDHHVRVILSLHCMTDTATYCSRAVPSMEHVRLFIKIICSPQYKQTIGKRSKTRGVMRSESCFWSMTFTLISLTMPAPKIGLGDPIYGLPPKIGRQKTAKSLYFRSQIRSFLRHTGRTETAHHLGSSIGLQISVGSSLINHSQVLLTRSSSNFASREPHEHRFRIIQFEPITFATSKNESR